MSGKERIAALLAAAFKPLTLEVVDESDRHKGHAGWRDGGETHYRVKIVADAFAGLSRVEAHRRVNAALAPEFSRGLHALAIEVRAPS